MKRKNILFSGVNTIFGLKLLNTNNRTQTHPKSNYTEHHPLTKTVKIS